MPVTKSATKALRQSERKTIINKPVKSRARTAVKEVRKNPSEKTLTNAFSALDKAIKRNLVPKGRVNRLKSRLAKFVRKSTTA
jgi:small subunit ribosomal protein S20